MEIKMRHISNAASTLALILVLTVFILNLTGVTACPMEDTLRTALFIKGVFLQVDVSCWINAFRH